MPKRSNLIFKTDRIQVSYIYQNHLDLISCLLQDFTQSNKGYKWSFVAGKNEISGEDEVSKFIWKNQLTKLDYFVEDISEKEQIHIKINDGVIFNIKNGSHTLYGLYHLLIDELSLAQSPSHIVFLRKYWLFNLTAALTLIPALILLLTNHAIWIIGTTILAALISGVIYGYYYDSLSEGASTSSVLPTRIKYGEYNSKTSYPIQATLTSTKTMVSIFASIATIATFIIYIVNS